MSARVRGALPAWLVHVCLALTTFLVWKQGGRYTVTGDEPHYLIMASGLVEHRTFEQTAPYQQELATPEILPGLAQRDFRAHTVVGPHGRYNVHNIGLPVLLAVPYAVGGVLGAKLFFILLTSLVVPLCWKLSGVFTEVPLVRLLSTAAVAIGMPLLPAASQLYPDIVAGLLCLNALYWLLTVERERSLAVQVLYAVSLAYLPWLQIKFAAASAVLMLAVGHAAWTKGNRRLAVLAAAVLGASLVGLALFNQYAYGKPTGPYQSGALQVSKTALMVLFGLHLDQNQGFLLQNPMHFVGVLYLGVLLRENPRAALALAVTFASLIVPNGLHPRWYGGGSLSGRFEWAATIVFMGATTFGLVRLARRAPRAFRVLVGCGLALQLYLFVRYTFTSISLYQKLPATRLDLYSNFFEPLRMLLPAAYNVTWAYRYLPNLAFGLLALALLLVGLLRTEPTRGRALWLGVGLGFAGLLAVAGFSGAPKAGLRGFDLDDLPSHTGMFVNGVLLAREGQDPPGAVVYGPYLPLARGDYRLRLQYRSSARPDQPIGTWDVYNADANKIVTGGPLNGSSGEASEVNAGFYVDHDKPARYEFRMFWNGVGTISVHGVELGDG
ncbi:MAG TPA: hypothetical protein VK447_07945 [Myxococcaceae bacterium]|nr:hypothetical protein [Myxococcaceae bacterium]